MAQNFTTDVTQWQGVDDEPTAESDNLVKSGGIASMYGSYIENPEFVYVKTDSEGRILWAIKIDGGIYYGAGVPQQVIDYIEEKLADFSPDEYDDIVSFLNDLEKDNKTLQVLLNEKVDKAEGKSLIDAEVADSVHYIENPEYIQIEVDSEDKVLGGRKADGTKFENMPIETPDVTIESIESPEFVGVWLDSDNKILLGIQSDGNIVFDACIPNQIKEYIEQRLSKQENFPFNVYLPVVKSLKRTIINSSTALPSTDYVPYSLLVCADMHNYTDGIKRVVEFAQQYATYLGVTYLDDSIILGDIVANSWTQYNNWEFNVQGYNSILKVIGNHDVSKYNDSATDATEAQSFSRYMHNIQNWGVQYQSDKCYYYKDYNQSNVRLIVLDCMHQSQEQRDWLEYILYGENNNDSALVLGRHVIICRHIPIGNLDTNNFTPLDCNFSSLDFPYLPHDMNEPEILSIVNNFQNAGGVFVTYLYGHYHHDVIGSYNNYPRQSFIVFPAGVETDFWKDVIFDKDNSFRDQFTIFSIDTKMKFIRLYRIGAYFDRHLVHRGSLVLGYDNNLKVINQY